MTDRFYLKPGDGLKVVDPDTGEPLPADGADVPKTPYWLRRLRDGDVTRTARPKTRTKNKESSS